MSDLVQLNFLDTGQTMQPEGLKSLSGLPGDPGGNLWSVDVPEWRAWTLDTDADEAAAAFLRRYGQAPERIVEAGGLLLLGPIPEATP